MTDDRRQTTDDRQQATDNDRRQTTDNRLQTTDYRRQTADDRLQMTLRFLQREENPQQRLTCVAIKKYQLISFTVASQYTVLSGVGVGIGDTLYNYNKTDV